MSNRIKLLERATNIKFRFETKVLVESSIMSSAYLLEYLKKQMTLVCSTKSGKQLTVYE